MYIGNYATDSYYSVKAYAAQPCDWWNVGCHAGAWFHNTVEGTVKSGTDAWNQQMQPALIMMGIAALGIVAIAMVLR